MPAIVSISMPRFSKLVTWDHGKKKIVNRNIFVQLYHRIAGITKNGHFNYKVKNSAHEAVLDFLQQHRTSLRQRLPRVSENDLANLSEIISLRLKTQLETIKTVIDAESVTKLAEEYYSKVVTNTNKMLNDNKKLGSAASPQSTKARFVLLENPNPYHNANLQQVDDQPLTSIQPQAADARLEKAIVKTNKRLEKLRAMYQTREGKIEKLMNLGDKISTKQKDKLTEKIAKNQNLARKIEALRTAPNARKTKKTASKTTAELAGVIEEPKQATKKEVASPLVEPVRVEKQKKSKRKILGSKKLGKLVPKRKMPKTQQDDQPESSLQAFGNEIIDADVLKAGKQTKSKKLSRLQKGIKKIFKTK